MDRVVRCACLFSGVVGLSACGGLTLPDRAPGIQGEIVGIGPGVPFGSAQAMWVKETPDEACGIVFRTTDAEVVVRGGDGGLEPRATSDLTLGMSVRVWFDAVAESCPGQSDAEVIEIVSE